MTFLGFCDKCKKFKLLIRKRTDGESDFCKDCIGNKEWEELKGE